MSHTPGPWKLSVDERPSVVSKYVGYPGYEDGKEYYKYSYKVTDSEGLEVQSCGMLDEVNKDSKLANAQLIAAAPELLEALERLVFTWKSDIRCEMMRYPALAPCVHTMDMRVKTAEQAIKKAKGEA